MDARLKGTPGVGMYLVTSWQEPMGAEARTQKLRPRPLVAADRELSDLYRAMDSSASDPARPVFCPGSRARGHAFALSSLGKCMLLSTPQESGCINHAFMEIRAAGPVNP